MKFIKERIARSLKTDFKRIYVEDKELLNTKFKSGERYSYIVDIENKKVRVVPYELEGATGKGKISRRKLEDTTIPLVDIGNPIIRETFKGMKQCKITIYDDEIIVEPLVEEATPKPSIINKVVDFFKGKEKVEAKKEVKVKYSVKKNMIDILLRKVSGASNSSFEQISFLNSLYTFEEDSFTQSSLCHVANDKASLMDLSKTLTYFELFAGSGIGGKALDEAGFQNVGYSEFNKFAVENYEANFPNRTNYGDITKIDETKLPDFDILIGGSPCQDVSTMKQNREGLDGENSKLFFDYIRILNHKKPKWFIFENVKGLLNSNNGNDFKVVKEAFEENYNIMYKVLNTADYGIPHNRRRIYIVGQLKELGKFHYEFPEATGCNITVQDLLESKVPDKYYLSEKMYDYVMSWGSGGFSAKPETDLPIARTLVASMHKMKRASTDNYYTTEYQPKGKTNLRKPMPRECARLQGLDDDYKFVVSDTQAYRLMGNAMSLNVVRAIVDKLKEAIARCKIIRFEDLARAV